MERDRIVWLEHSSPDLIPWAWGVNGAVSVVAPVLAALVAGAICYGVAMAAVKG